MDTLYMDSKEKGRVSIFHKNKMSKMVEVKPSAMLARGNMKCSVQTNDWAFLRGCGTQNWRSQVWLLEDFSTLEATNYHHQDI